MSPIIGVSKVCFQKSVYKRKKTHYQSVSGMVRIVGVEPTRFPVRFWVWFVCQFRHIRILLIVYHIIDRLSSTIRKKIGSWTEKSNSLKLCKILTQSAKYAILNLPTSSSGCTIARKELAHGCNCFITYICCAWHCRRVGIWV